MKKDQINYEKEIDSDVITKIHVIMENLSDSQQIPRNLCADFAWAVRFERKNNGNRIRKLI